MNVYKLSVSEYLLSVEGADANDDFSEWAMPRGFVILANSESEARDIAAANGAFGDHAQWWLDGKLTTCEMIDPSEGLPRVIIVNQPTG